MPSEPTQHRSPDGSTPAEPTRYRSRESAAPGEPTSLRPSEGTAPAEPATQYRQRTPTSGVPDAPEPTRLRGAAAAAPAGEASRAAPASGSDSAPGATPRVAPAAGLVLRGRYRLERLIGQGAMGQVWEARHLLSEEAGEQRPLVAVKLFVADFERDPNALALMQREASRAQRLSHPNIVSVHFFDRDERSGLLFMAMELVDGPSLDQLLKERGLSGLPREEGVPIIRGIAEGLAHAHQQGIVHCDLKPGNVLVTRRGVPKILDFGIAQAVQLAESAGCAAAAQGSAAGSHGTAAGAPASEAPLISGYTESYASPEALENQPAHPADDVFALGLVSYEIAAGRHAFGGESALRARQRGAHPARPAGLRRHEWRAIQRALAFERARRWPDAGAFRKAFVGASTLHRWLAAAVAALILIAAGLGYRSYRATLPAVPFARLSPATQAAVRKALHEGNEALEYVRRTHDYSVLGDAAVAFDQADALHPRNPDAVAGLKETAALAVDWAQSARDPAAAAEELRKLKERTSESRYYEHFAPLDHEIAKLAREAGN